MKKQLPWNPPTVKSSGSWLGPIMIWGKRKSIEVFENAISNEEDKIVKADLYFNLGVIHNQMQNFGEAEKSFDEAFFLNEDDFEAALGMAQAYEGLGNNYLNGEEGFEKDLDEAARWYRKAEKKLKQS